MREPTGPTAANVGVALIKRRPAKSVNLAGVISSKRSIVSDSGISLP